MSAPKIKAMRDLPCGLSQKASARWPVSFIARAGGAGAFAGAFGSIGLPVLGFDGLAGGDDQSGADRAREQGGETFLRAGLRGHVGIGGVGEVEAGALLDRARAEDRAIWRARSVHVALPT